MKEISVLIAGIRGDGIDNTGLMVSKLFSRLGYQIYMYNDIPSLIIGGHQFVLVRAGTEKISTHKDNVDIVLAYNQDAIDKHKMRFNDKTIFIYDKDKATISNEHSIAIGMSETIQDKAIIRKLRGICLIAGLCKVLDIELKIFEDILKNGDSALMEEKIKAVRLVYDDIKIKIDQKIKINKEAISETPALPILSGSEAISLGLLKAGLEAYIAYPMTPASQILEFLAGHEKDLGLHIVLPESEIAVMLMALGYSYMGIRSAVGTSGGGFSLMVEALGLAGQAELPVVVVMGQRAGPSTGMPTYTSQTDLHFVLNASQGEFPRFIVAPGDAEEACYWSGIAMNKAWKYQMPAFVLVDKTLCMGYSSFDESLVPELFVEQPAMWDGIGDYKRYRISDDGVSPLAFPPLSGQAVKSTGYVHNEYGITTEKPEIAKGLADKWILKEKQLAEDLMDYETVKVYGEGKSAILCWGSNKGVCLEIAKKYSMKVIQMVVLSPFPAKALANALKGVDKLVNVECNAKGQLAMLLQQNGFKVDEQILKYDGRPYSIEDLDLEVKKVME